MNKHTVLGVICIIAAIGLFVYQQMFAPPPPPPPAKPSVPTVQSTSTGMPVNTELLAPGATLTATEKESTYVLENDYIAVTFTNFGGAIKEVALKKYAGNIENRDNPEKFPYVFNKTITSLPFPPALNLSDANSINNIGATVLYSVESVDANTIRFRGELGRIIIEREYRVHIASDEKDPYIITNRTSFYNKTEDPINVGEVYFNLGTVAPSRADISGRSLSFVYFKDGKIKFEHANNLAPSSGFLGFGSRDKARIFPYDGHISGLDWAAVKNQFFTAILIPQNVDEAKKLNADIFAKSVDFGTSAEDIAVKYGMNGNIAYNIGQIDPNATKDMVFDYYVGPKEFDRLQALGHDASEIMDYGWFGFFSKSLLTMMKLINRVIPNWGLTIIVLTIIIKLLLWPLSAKAARSSKRMQKLQKPLAELNEKYKDNPQKKQQETLRLFKEHKINPAAGCWPMLIQIPIFIGLYWMLSSSSELRYAEFLWIKDLSQPDTIAYIFGVPFNILPFLMMGTSLVQMRLMPTPATDNPQMKMMKWMPVMFFFICYNFSAGLVVYWTIQNLFSIGQQLLTNRMPDPEGDKTFEEHPVKSGKKKRGKW